MNPYALTIWLAVLTAQAWLLWAAPEAWCVVTALSAVGVMWFLWCERTLK